MNVSVVVATYNRAHLLADTLAALLAQDVPASFGWEVVVVDNNSRDRTPQTVERFAATSPVPVRYCFEARQGKTYALNTGLAVARGDIVAFTDDDVLPEPDWVASAAAAIGRWSADGVGGRILPRWEAPPPSWLERRESLRAVLALIDFDEPRALGLPKQEAPPIWGANMAFRRRLFDTIGGFNTARGPRGAKLYRDDETELIRRALRLGRTIVYDPSLTVFHRIGPDRMRKRYFRRWAFDSAEGATLASPSIARSRHLLGIPPWAWRITAGTVLRWASHAAIGRPDTFERELDVMSQLGHLSGHRKMRQAAPRRTASSYRSASS